jgi:subtilase family protein
MAFVDVELIDGLGLPYAAGAEAALSDAALDPAFALTWSELLTTFPGLTLEPLFAAQPVAELADLVDAVRTAGAEPPDPFRWFMIPCDPTVADALAAAVQALPFVAGATRRLPSLLAGTVSWGTNPDAARTNQIQAAPIGVDAIHVWNVPGGTGGGARLADVENGWNTNHEELLTARVSSPSGFVADTVSDGGHGTAVAGILVGADNGAGTIGIVPDATLTLFQDQGAFAADSLAGALALQAIGTAARIAAATTAVGPGGVLLLEEAQNFFARPNRPDGSPDLRPDILSEFQPAVQTAIRLAGAAGVTVIEPAGNGGVDLDAFPFLAHTRPGSPTFSGAVVVGAGEFVPGGPGIDDSWKRASFSSFGSRVDCFAAGSSIRAPSNAAPDAYLAFSGTSGASAIVAGVAAALQSMVVAATQRTLSPADVRRLLSDPDLATTIPAGADGGIGAMPDLRKLADSQGFARVLPVGAATVADDAMVLVHLDEGDHLVRRHWTFFTGWGTPLPLPAPADGLELTPGQPAVTSTEEHAPLDRLVQDAFVMGPLGIHHLFWDSNDEIGDLLQPLKPASVAPFFAAAQGRSLGVVRTLVGVVVIVAVSPEGRLVVMTGDPDLLTDGVSDPLVLSPTASFRRVAGPAVVSRAPGIADVVVIEDGGSLTWFAGRVPATIGTGWSAGVVETTTEFDPGARPALLATGDVLLAAAVGSEGWLRVTTIDPAAGAVAAPVVVDVQVTIDTSGPVALAVAGANVVVLGIDTDGVLRAATRPAAGGEWSALGAVPAPQLLGAFGGVTAVTMVDVGVMAIAVARDGTILFALSADGTIWSPLLPLG